MEKEQYYSYLFCTIYDPVSLLRIVGTHVLTNLQGPLPLTGIRIGNGIGNGNGNGHGDRHLGIGNR